MNTSSERGVSPVVGVILVVAVTVILSAAIGAFVLNLGQQSSTASQAELGVSTSTNGSNVTVQVVTGTAEELHLRVNGTTVDTLTSPTPGDVLEAPASPDSTISIVSVSGGAESVVTTQTSLNTEQQPVTAPTDGLISHYRLNGGATDSESGYDGTTNGGLTWSDDAIEGQSADFDGSDDYINLGSPSELSLDSQFTISAWVKPRSVTGGDYGRTIIRKGGGTWSYIFRFDDSSGDLVGLVNDGSTTAAVTTPHSTTDEWVHVTFISTGSELQLWVNGTLENTTSSTVVPQDTTIDIAIGSDGGGSKGMSVFDGHIDDLRIYNRTLSEDEARDLYNATK